MNAFDTFVQTVSREILDPIITLLALAAFILFVWGVVTFIRNADNDEKRKTGKQHMVWGIIGLALIFGAAAIVNVLKGIVGAGG